MPNIEGILEIAREVSGVDWQARPGCIAEGDEDTFTLMPVGKPGEDQDYTLIFFINDPEEGVLSKKLEVMPMHEFIHSFVEAEDG